MVRALDQGVKGIPSLILTKCFFSKREGIGLLTSKGFLADEPSCSITRFVLPVEVSEDDPTFFAWKISLVVIPVHEVWFTAVQPCHDSVIVHITNTDPGIRHTT